MVVSARLEQLASLPTSFLFDKQPEDIIAVMTCRILVLLFFVLAVTAQIPEATYRIYSGKSDTSLRSYTVGEPCYVSITSEDPGPYELVSLITSSVR